eukprot:g3216.t1
MLASRAPRFSDNPPRPPLGSSHGVSERTHPIDPQVLKVPPSNPLAWQTSLIDSEVDSILDGGVFGQAKNGGRHGSVHGGGQHPTGEGMPPPGQRREFLRRGGGRTSAGGTNGPKETGRGGGVGGEGAEGGGTRRLDLVPGEVCPVCQEEMEEESGGEVDLPAEAAPAEGRLTYCRDGCGNNMHARCMLMYAEHRRSSGEKPCCPLCRVDWGLAAVRALRNDAPPREQDSASGRSRRRSGGGRGGAEKTVLPVACRSCNVKVQAVFFRCLVCSPAGSWDLCRRCYAASGIRRSHHGGGSALGPCVSVGSNRHPFVQGEAATDPPEWKPAEPPSGGRGAAGRVGGGGAGVSGSAAAGVLSLQGREITTADFELLLTLDASTVPPLHKHLLEALPPHNGANAGGGGLGEGSFFSSPTLGSRPPAGVERDDHGGGGSGVIDSDGDNGRISEALPLQASTSPSRSVGRATVAAMLSSSSSTPVPSETTPSLLDLVAEAALARDAAAATTAATAVAESHGGEAAAEGGGAETTACSGGAPMMPTTAAPSLPSDEVAPVSGSFPVGPVVSCCYCSHLDAVGEASQASENNGNFSSRSTATRLTEQRRRLPSPPAPVAPSSQAAPLRRLPCGHNAHEACLIPLILESVGRGDPSQLRCPLDSSPIFPALSRRRRRARQPRPGSDSGVSPVAAGGHGDHRRNTRSASSAPPAAVGVVGGGGADRHARAAAARELLRRNTAAGLGSGGAVNAADALGIALFGSGLARPALLPLPPSTRGHATATFSPAGPRPGGGSGGGGGSIRRTAWTRDAPGWTSGRAGLNGATVGGDAGDGGSGPRVRRNTGRDAGGGAGPGDGPLGGEPRLQGHGLFVGGEGIADAPGGEDSAAARAGRVENGGGPAARSSRRRRRRSASVVRGSTVGGGAAGRRSSGGSTGRGGDYNEGYASGVGAADSMDGLELTTCSFAASGRGGAEESWTDAGDRPSQEGGDEAGRRGSGRGRETLAVGVGSQSLAVGPAMARRVPPARPTGRDGMAVMTAGG